MNDTKLWTRIFFFKIKEKNYLFIKKLKHNSLFLAKFTLRQWSSQKENHGQRTIILIWNESPQDSKPQEAALINLFFLFIYLQHLEAIEFLKNHTLLYIPIASCEPKGQKTHWKLINSARVTKMNTNERRVVVAVDESEESMHALSWCLNNLFSPDTNNTLVLLYVKPPLPVHSSFDAAGQNSHFLRSICPLQTLDLSMFYRCFILLDIICSWVMMTSHSTKHPSSRRIYILKWCHQGRREIR